MQNKEDKDGMRMFYVRVADDFSTRYYRARRRETDSDETLKEQMQQLK
jgi:hypothetical protein